MDHLDNTYEKVKDYNLQYKIRNGPMLEAMRRNGYVTARQLFLASGVSQQTIGRYLNLSYPPVNKHGKFHQSIKKLGDLLATPPDLLFPQQHLTEALKINEGEVSLSLEDIQQLSGNLLTDGPETLMLDGEKLAKVVESLDVLTDRERKIIEDRYYATEPKTLEELGVELGVSRERIRQIEKESLHKIKRRLNNIYDIKD